MCAYHVPNRLDRGRILYYGVPRYYWTIIGYLSEHKLQEIYFLPGILVIGERYCFSIVGEAAQRLGLSLFHHVVPSARNGAKLLSNDKV